MVTSLLFEDDYEVSVNKKGNKILVDLLEPYLDVLKDYIDS